MTDQAIHDKTVIDAEPARPVAEPDAPSRSERARKAAYRSRFVLVYVALAVIAGGAVGAFVVLLSKPEAAPAPSWSDWKPDGSRDAQVKQIADYVAKRYRLPDGDQMAVALASAPKVLASAETGDLPVGAIVVRPDTSRGQAEEDEFEIIRDAGSTSIQYVLCGLGDNCSITQGQPSEARHALLRREALELSLYTFKYVDGVKTVTVFLPPRPPAPGEDPPSATTVFLKRSDVSDELHKPLTRTLTPLTPGIGQMIPRELTNVNRITRTRLYDYDYQLAQDGTAIMILSPILDT